MAGPHLNNTLNNDIQGGAAAFMPASGNSPFPPSAIAQAGLIPLAFTIFGLLTYGQLAIAFTLIQEGLK